MEKMYVLAVVFFGMAGCSSEANIEKFCLETVCYEKELNSQKESDVKQRYLELVNLINEDPMAIVQFTGELSKNSQNPAQSMKKYFGWIKPESLHYIIPGDKSSAVLLKNASGDRFVIYYSHEIEKFEVSYETPDGYSAVDDLWVNGKSEPVIGK